MKLYLLYLYAKIAWWYLQAFKPTLKIKACSTRVKFSQEIEMSVI